MDDVGKWVTVIFFGLLLLLLLPRVRQIPGRDLLRYIAIWLALFAALGLLYRCLHPDEFAAPAESPAAAE